MKWNGSEFRMEISEDTHLICSACGWCHFVVARGELGGATCFHCGGNKFTVATAAVVASRVLPGTTLQPLMYEVADYTIRSEALDEMVRVSQDMGLYDFPENMTEA